MHNRQSGLVLVFVLLLIIVLSGWVMAAIDQANLATQVSWHHWQYVQAQQVAQHGVLQARNDLMSGDSHCVVGDVTLQGYSDIGQWWPQHGCAGVFAGKHYYYLLALIGESHSDKFYKVVVSVKLGLTSVVLQTVQLVNHDGVMQVSWLLK